MLRRILLLFGIAALSGCATYNGMITSPSTLSSDTKATYVDMAVGYSRTSYLFGFGGFGKAALINEAKRNMYKAYKLAPNQTFVSPTLDIKTTTYGPYRKMEVIMMADVVEYDGNVDVGFEEEYFQAIGAVQSDLPEFFRLNESVVVMGSNRSIVNGRILNINQQKITVLLHNADGRLAIKNLASSRVFRARPAPDGDLEVAFSVGEAVVFNERVSSTEQVPSGGLIVGVNQYNVLVMVKDQLIVRRIFDLKKAS